MPESFILDKKISIHALRTEGDDSGSMGSHPRKISIHALRTEGDEDNQVFWNVI